MGLPKTNKALASRVSFLERKLADVRRSMVVSVILPVEWRLTPKERDLFFALLSNDIVTKPMAMLVLYDTEDRPTHSVDVFISRIRSKTEPHSVRIETINRVGYRLVDRAVWAKTLKLDTPVEH